MIRTVAKRLLRRFGFDVTRRQPYGSYIERLVATLRNRGVTSAIDVGANRGQFGMQLREAGYAGRILSFEPLPGPHAALEAVARKDGNWHVAPPMALGERAGEIEIRVSANSVSSSSLRMLDSHLRAAPDSRPVAIERVPLRMLDDEVLPRLRSGEMPFLKIDVQGAERAVLGGATRVLERVAVLQLELSLVPLYEGQWLFDDAYAALCAAGFRFADAVAGFHDPVTGELLQLDGLFVRPPTALE